MVRDEALIRLPWRGAERRLSMDSREWERDGAALGFTAAIEATWSGRA
jgi:hypothetical protein